MGWTYTKLNGTMKQELTRLLTWETEENSNKVLDMAIVKLKTMYAAVERIHKNTGEREVWAAVFMLNFVPNAADGYNFGYKDMCESMGPYQTECPERILKLLTPTSSEFAIKWRMECWAGIQKRKETKLTVGDMVKFKSLIKFRDGSTLHYAVVTRFRGSAVILNDYYRVPRSRLVGSEVLNLPKVQVSDVRGKKGARIGQVYATGKSSRDMLVIIENDVPVSEVIVTEAYWRNADVMRDINTRIMSALDGYAPARALSKQFKGE